MERDGGAEIGRAIDFFPLTGNKPPSQTVAPLCFEASVNLAGFLAAAVIRDLARINRSYKSLFLSRFPRIGAWLVAEETRSNGRRKCFPLPESEERIETCDYSVASSAETKGPCDERTSVGRFIYIYIYTMTDLLSEIIRAAISFSRESGSLDINDSTYRRSRTTAREHSTDFFDYFS